MAQNSLVEVDLDATKRLVTSLDGSGRGIYAAYWMFSEESETWFLHLAGVGFDFSGRKWAYEQIQRAIRHESIETIALHRVVVTSPDDPTLQLLEVAIRVPGLSDVRFSGNVVNGQRIPDAIIVRIDRKHDSTLGSPKPEGSQLRLP